MLSDNLTLLRSLRGCSQEEIAEVIGISRQAYAKWEKGETIPDVERCLKLAEWYGTTLDALVQGSGQIGTTPLPPGPKGKHIFGTVKLNSRGQILIPKRARALFDLRPNDELVILGDEAEGIAVIKAEQFEQRLNQALDSMRHQAEE